MGLIIKPTVEKKICIQGTTIELPEVYVRIAFAGRANGVSMDVYFSTYTSHDEYILANPVPSNLPVENLLADIDPITQVQGLEAAHELAKVRYESLGYDVTINLL